MSEYENIFSKNFKTKWNTQKELDILKIKDIILHNNNIKLDKLLAKLETEDPFMSKKRAFELVEALDTAGSIKVSENDEVTLCQ